jgi:hypothetical protein
VQRALPAFEQIKSLNRIHEPVLENFVVGVVGLDASDVEHHLLCEELIEGDVLKGAVTGVTIGFEKESQDGLDTVGESVELSPKVLIRKI